LRVLDTQDLHSLRHLRERLAFSGKSIREISAARLGTWRTSHIPEPLSYTNRGLRYGVLSRARSYAQIRPDACMQQLRVLALVLSANILSFPQAGGRVFLLSAPATSVCCARLRSARELSDAR
jgi:hypothetical protein